MSRLASEAEEASRSTGIPAKFMLGQAALESGWGKRQIVAADGTPSHNLFGIKATGNWNGRVVEAVTTEYVNGVPQKKVEKFRAYDSYADSFRDYAQLMRSNPRYENVLANAPGRQGLRAGIAARRLCDRSAVRRQADQHHPKDPGRLTLRAARQLKFRGLVPMTQVSL